jgi:hypothetical protein
VPSIVTEQIYIDDWVDNRVIAGVNPQLNCGLPDFREFFGTPFGHIGFTSEARDANSGESLELWILTSEMDWDDGYNTLILTSTHTVRVMKH